MTDNERIVEAMGWEYRKGVAGRDGLGPMVNPCWRRCLDDECHHEERRGQCPDYFTDPALLGEMVEWLADRDTMSRVRLRRSSPGWDAIAAGNGCTGDTLQEAVARCVLWVLEDDQ